MDAIFTLKNSSLIVSNFCFSCTALAVFVLSKGSARSKANIKSVKKNLQLFYFTELAMRRKKSTYHFFPIGF